VAAVRPPTGQGRTVGGLVTGGRGAWTVRVRKSGVGGGDRRRGGEVAAGRGGRMRWRRRRR
jgi:hypothetical protein